VGLATVMVLTFTSPERMEARGLHYPLPDSESQVSLDAIQLPWDDDALGTVVPSAR